MKKGQKSKQEIFNKAVQLFSERGIENVSMRELAAACDLSLGAFYYHFKNKEDLILYFYQDSLKGHINRSENFLETAPQSLPVVMEWVCRDRFNEFSPYKEMLKPLVFSFNSKSPLSPWARESYPIRLQSVDLFKRLTQHCTSLKKEPVVEVVARILWMQHLMILGLWMISEADKNRGEILLEESKKFWKWLPSFLKIPGSGKTLTKIAESLEKVGLWESYESK